MIRQYNNISTVEHNFIFPENFFRVMSLLNPGMKTQLEISCSGVFRLHSLQFQKVEQEVLGTWQIHWEELKLVPVNSNGLCLGRVVQLCLAALVCHKCHCVKEKESSMLKRCC